MKEKNESSKVITPKTHFMNMFMIVFTEKFTFKVKITFKVPLKCKCRCVCAPEEAHAHASVF